MKKYLFSIYAYVVWCPTWSKNLGQYLLKTDVLTRLLTSVCPCWHSSLLDEVICRSVICQMSHASLLICPTSTLLQHFSEFGGRAEVYSLMVYRKSCEIVRNDVKIEMRSFVMNLTKDSYRYGWNTPHWSLKIWNQ